MADVRRGPGTSSPGAPYGESASGSGGDGGSDLVALKIEVAKIQTRLERMATQEDILRLKVWILAGVLGGMAIAATLAATIARLFLQEPAP